MFSLYPQISLSKYLLHFDCYLFVYLPVKTVSSKRAEIMCVLLTVVSLVFSLAQKKTKKQPKTKIKHTKQNKHSINIFRLFIN